MTAVTYPTPFAYIETTIPAGVTIDEFRRSRPARPGRFQRFVAGFRPQAPAASPAVAQLLNPELALPGRW
jgi:hypothetical protein